MKKIILSSVLAILAFGFVGCATTQAPTTTTSNTTTSTPAVATISSVDLALIQGAATVATGAVLQFVETTPSSRTELANEIYASANALYSLSTGAIPTAAQINSTIVSFAGTNPVAQYTQYASVVSSLYASELAKFGSNGKNAVAVLGALAAGAQSGASAYITVPVVTPTATTTTTTSN